MKTIKDTRLKKWGREHRKTKDNSYKCFTCGGSHKYGHKCKKMIKDQDRNASLEI